MWTLGLRCNMMSMVREWSVMRVSVVIPTYSRPKDLSELDSFLKQTVMPLEVMVDDTPSNIIEEVCAKY